MCSDSARLKAVGGMGGDAGMRCQVYGAAGAVLVLLLWHSLHAGPAGNACFPHAVPEVGSGWHALCVTQSLSGARMLSSGAMECNIHLFRGDQSRLGASVGTLSCIDWSAEMRGALCRLFPSTALKTSSFDCRLDVCRCGNTTYCLCCS